jgi:signal transduction histidine kinase/ligand-binding sensor domain-containing protein
MSTAGVLCLLAAIGWPRSGPGKESDAGPWKELTPPVFQLIATQTHPGAGLPYTATPFALAQDEAGFIWIATQGGVERWDGYELRTYPMKRGDPCALQSSFVMSLFMDQSRRLWLGSLGGGLYRYDPETDCIRAIAGESAILADASIESMANDGAGGLWVGTRTGLVRIAADLTQVSRADIDVGERGNWSNGRVARVLTDRRGALWVGTDKGLARRESSDRPFQAVPLAPGVKVRELFESSDGRIWVGTVANGAFVIDPSTLTTRGIDDILKRKPVPLIWKAAETATGQIWLGTPSAGILVVEPASLKTRVLQHQQGLASTLDDDSVSGLLRDRRGLIWAATDTGVGFFHSGDQISTIPLGGESLGLPEGRIGGMARMSDDRVALTIGRGLYLIGPGRQVAQRVPLDERWAPESLIAIATLNGRDLFVTDQPTGLVWIDRSTGRTYPVALPGPGNSRHPVALLADGERLWVAALEGVWLVERNPSGPTAASPWVTTRRFDVRDANAIAAGSDGARWIGTFNGLFRGQAASAELTPVHLVSEDGTAVPLSLVSTLLTDRRGRLWVGTNSEGVFVLDVTRDSQHPARVLRHLDEELPGGAVAQLLEDDGGVWAATDRGLARIDAQSFTVRRFDRGDGVAVDAYAPRAGLTFSADTLLFGGQDGITLVNPNRPAPPRPPPPVVITRISVGHRDIPSARYNIDPTERTVEVPADTPSLMVEFSALDYANPQPIRYAYRLEGFDREWVKTGSGARMAMYTNLPPGAYHLRIRGTDHAGVWSPLERQLAIHVAAAWYQAAWFRALEVFGVLLSLLFILQASTALLRARQRELESLVAERTEALVRATDERNSLIENLAHDLRTPLTSLRGYLDRLNAHDDSLTEADRGRFTAIAVRQAERLIRLVRELFELVRLDDPLARLTLESFRPAEVVQDVVREFDSIADGRGIDCTLDPGAESAQIVGDISLFQRLIDNLVVNAVSHTPANGRITVRLGTEPAGIVFEVSDTGRGIERGDLERIFNRYERIDSSGRIAGAGLGLAIVKRILELHAGSIAVASELGRGTRFTVRLPWGGPAASAGATTFGGAIRR